MKVYFTASAKARQKYKNEYKRMVEFLENDGHVVFSEVLSAHLPGFSKIPSLKLKDWYKEWSSYTRECDFALVEGSYPSSIHIGFEIGLLLSRSKPVVLLFRKGCDPIFVNSYYSNRLIKCEYDVNDLNEVLEWSIEEVKALANRRFTFNISSEIDDYLSQVANSTDISKSEFIRELIEREMQEES